MAGTANNTGAALDSRATKPSPKTTSGNAGRVFRANLALSSPTPEPVTVHHGLYRRWMSGRLDGDADRDQHVPPVVAVHVTVL
jgi:hypothetical protein